MKTEKLILVGRQFFPDTEPHLFFYSELNVRRGLAAEFLTKYILMVCGEGDGENGGKGILQNCYGDIWNALFTDGHYDYADMSFYILDKTDMHT